MSLIDHVDKRTINGEIIVTLFEQCNLTCKFCPQDHASIIGMDRIKEKKDYIIQSILHLRKQGRTQFSVHLMGGEVFSDLISFACFDSLHLLRCFDSQGLWGRTPFSPETNQWHCPPQFFLQSVLQDL